MTWGIFGRSKAFRPTPAMRDAIAEGFDATFYRANYPDVAAAGVDPLDHFLNFGWREMRRPRADFDMEYYLKANPDVAAAKLNPFYHYLAFGDAEGRLPMAASDPLDPEALRATAAELFDAQFYLQTYPDVAALQMDPLDHFIQIGSKEGHLPRTNAEPIDIDGRVPEGVVHNRLGQARSAVRILHMREAIRPYFDEAFYLEKNADVAAAGVDPIIHYLRHGWREGRRPASDFDPRYYLGTNADVSVARVEPLYHYVTWGRGEGRTGSQPEADPNVEIMLAQDRTPRGILRTILSHVRGAIQALRIRAIVKPHFDVDLYRKSNPDVVAAGLDPLTHYLEEGWREGRRPAPYFDPVYYLGANGDVARAGVEPFHHYLIRGRREGRFPTPKGASLDAEALRASAAEVFDAAFYLRTYPDAAESRLDPLDHYLQIGAAEGRRPNTEVQPPELDGKAPEGVFHTYFARARGTIQLLHMRAVIQPRFDVEFYLGENADVEAAGVDPMSHYLRHGWREGRRPAPHFDPTYYLAVNPDVADAQVEPFYHYVECGRDEGRSPEAPGGYRTKAIYHTVEIEERVRRAQVQPSQLLSAQALLDKLDQAGLRQSASIVLALSHDDYLVNTGGVQICVAGEERAFTAAGSGYVQLSPLEHISVFSPRETKNVAVHVNVNGRSIGNTLVESVLFALASYSGKPFDLVLHALHGHSLDAVLRIIHTVSPVNVVFWIHDYFAICPGFNLLRNDAVFCGAPPAESLACSICVYGEERRRHLEMMERLFRSAEIDVVAPSQTALDMLCSHSKLPIKSAIVHPHCTMVANAAAVSSVRSPVRSDTSRPLRVAFVGHSIISKGWPVFVRLLEEMHGNPEFEFYHFAVRRAVRDVRFVKTQITGDDRNGTARALKEHEIDLVVIPSPWPETFCFVAYEALAAGAMIVTLADSGNVATLVRQRGEGLVCADEESLIANFRDGSVRRKVDARREQGIPMGDLVFGRMTADLLGEGRP